MAADDREMELEALRKEPVSEAEFLAAVQNLVGYLIDDEWRHYLEGEGPLDEHIVQSVLQAEAYLRGRRKSRKA